MTRYALVSAHNASAETIKRYLPGNYLVLTAINYPGDDRMMAGDCVVVGGEDLAGWTLNDYVIPRLASGLIVAREIDADHPAMKDISGEQRDIERLRVLDQAAGLDPEGMREAEYEGPGKFEGVEDQVLAVAIEILGGHGYADQEAGSVEDGLHGVRVGRWVVWTDDDGFKSLRAFDAETDASLALDEEEQHQADGLGASG